MTAEAFSTHGIFSRISSEWAKIGSFIWIKPLRSPMSIFLSLGGDLKNARREQRNK